MKHLYIINPISGKKNKRNLESLIKKESKHITNIAYTEYAGHAKEIAKTEHINYDAIIIAGGDGSVHEVFQGLIGTSTAMGILPFGSGNGFSNCIGIPLDTVKALQKINNSKKKLIDVAKINDIFFVNVAGIGFDALIAHKFALQKKRGFKSYLKVIMKEYRNFETINYTLSMNNDKIYNFDSFLLTVANGNQWGNNGFIAPAALIDDSLLNITVVDKFPIHAGIPIAAKLFTRKIEHSRYVKTFTCKKLSIQKVGNITAHIDGEPVFFKDKIDIEIMPKVLNVLV